MRGPKPLAVELTDEQRDALNALVRRHSTPQQLARRAQILLAAGNGRVSRTHPGRVSGTHLGP
jgi:hypothetical protein